jgi:hypothetical protein
MALSPRAREFAAAYAAQEVAAAERARVLGELFKFEDEITPAEMFVDNANTLYVITKVGVDGHRTHVFEMVPFSKIDASKENVDGKDLFTFNCSTLSKDPAIFEVFGMNDDDKKFTLHFTGHPNVKICRLTTNLLFNLSAETIGAAGGAGGGVSFMPKLKPNHRTWEFRER